MKRNNFFNGKEVFTLGTVCKKSEYYKKVLKFGKPGCMEDVKMCELVRVDSRNNCSQVSTCKGKVIPDSRPNKVIALELPYNILRTKYSWVQHYLVLTSSKNVQSLELHYV